MASTTPPVLSFWDRNAPFAAVAVANLANAAVEIKADPKATKDTVATLSFSSGDQFVGLPSIVRYLARAGSKTTQEGLYGADALAAGQIDGWLDYAAQSVVSGVSFELVCVSLNDFLTLRTFLVGYTVTIADVAVWGQLQGSPMWKKVKGSGKVPHLSRWFDFLTGLPQVRAALEALEPKKGGAGAAAGAAAGGKDATGASAASATDAKKGGGDTGSFDIGLPGAQVGKVVTRFPPEPSGYLHIGHAKAALLNQHFADMYQGKLLVRFDDTNPSKEKDEFVENILKDIRDLGLRHEPVTYTSDYFPQLLDIGERLIKAGVLYADDTPVEVMRQERLASVESKCRTRSVEETLKIFEEMKAGSETGLQNCIRIKIDMKALNGCMRDPVAFRCNLTPHHRTGLKYKVYPTYDFACPFVDSIEGVTHALRTSEYKDREEQFYWVLRAMQKVWPGLPDVHIWDYSRLNFVNTLLSKRKLTWFVESGRVDGWNDPRLPTVQGILRRGMRIEALKEFILSQGASKNVTLQEWDKIWTINKKVIDPVCPRHTAVEAEARVLCTLTNGPAQPEVVTVPKHQKYAGAGKKALVRSSSILLDQADARELKEGEEVTLMSWGNAIVKSIARDEATGAVTSISAELHLEGDVKKTKWKLTWLAASDELVELLLVDFDYLINKKKVEEDDDFMTLVNEKTRFEKRALGDANMRTLQRGDVIQLERKGYFIVDEPLFKVGRPIVLFNIPDGRTKTMSNKQAQQ